MADPLAPSAQVLHVRQSENDPKCDDDWNRWITTQSIDVKADEWITVPCSFDTDLVSVPNAFSWFIPRAGRFARAAVLHDHLWRLADQYDETTQEWKYDRRKADRQFRSALKNSEVRLLRRWIMWAAVRIAAIFTKKNRGKRWWLDVPGLAALALIALPFVGPPALLILPATFAFGALEKVIHHLTPKKHREELDAPKIQLWT